MQPAPALEDGWIPGTPAFAGAGEARDDRQIRMPVTEHKMHCKAGRDVVLGYLRPTAASAASRAFMVPM
jgi:hypothetical protein